MSETKLSPLERLALLRKQKEQAKADVVPVETTAVETPAVETSDAVAALDEGLDSAELELTADVVETEQANAVVEEREAAVQVDEVDAEAVVEAFQETRIEESDSDDTEACEVENLDDVETAEEDGKVVVEDSGGEILPSESGTTECDASEVESAVESVDDDDIEWLDDDSNPEVAELDADCDEHEVDEIAAVDVDDQETLSDLDEAPFEEPDTADGVEAADVATELEAEYDEAEAVDAPAEELVENAEEDAPESLLADLLDTPVEDLDFDFSDVGPVTEEEPEEDEIPEAAAEENYEEHSAESEESSTDKPPKYIKTGRGGVKKLGSGNHLDDLFARVNDLLGDTEVELDEPWKPPIPETLYDTGLTAEDVERIALKFLNSKGSASGRQIAGQLRLPFNIVEPLLKEWKQGQLIGYKNAAEMGDYVYVITEFGRDKARVYMTESTYFGAAPVQLTDYLKAMEQQSIAKQHATEADLKRAFSDLLISESMLDRLGPAVNSGRGMFLFGEPGNGKTSIAERITACFGSTIWIPRALGIDGDIIRLFDPGVHEAVDWHDTVSNATAGLFDVSGVDPRWVRITRPTVVAGGELTMDELEVTQNPQTKVCEAPLQLKSNCGTLVIDDFGRQTMPVDVLLNRWIVPLEKRYDFLNLPSGKKIQVPFDQLIVFSTNLEPKDLVDGAFLRRIPYKIEVPDPLPEHFRKLFHIMAPTMGLRVDDESIDYLVREHFEKAGRPFRACLPRDLLLQVRNYCLYKSLPKVMTPQAFDFAVENYFSVM